MPTIAELFIRLGADPAGFIRGLETASNSFENFVFRVDQSSRALRSIGLASSAAGTAILAFAGVAVAAAAQAQREQVLLAQAIEATGRAAEFSVEALNRQARALEQITPFSDEAVTSIQRLLVGFQLTQEEIEQLTPRVLDIAARLGVDVTTSALAVGRAFTFGVSGLRRLGVALDETADPIQNFDGFLQQIDRSARGAAEELGKTFVGALARFRNQVDNLLEVIGAPLLGPLTALAGAAARLAEAVRFVTETFPAATGAAVILTAALGVFLLGAGGLIVLLAFLPKVAGLMASWSTAMGVLAGTTVRATGGLTGFLIAARAVGREMGLTVPAIQALAGALARIPRLAVLAAGGLRLLRVAVTGLAGGVIGIVLFELAFRAVEAIVRKVAAVVVPLLERMGLLGASEAAAADAAEKLNASLQRQGQTLEQVEANYKEARSALELFSAETRRAAAESARLELLRPGIDEAGVKAALERLEGATRDAQVETAQRSLEIERNRLERLETIQEGFARRRRGGLATDLDAERKVADDIAAARKGIADAEEAITSARLSAVQKTREAEVAAGKAARDARIDAEQKVLEAAVTIGRARVEAERERIRETETLRADALRRVADLERTLADEALAAREALARASAAREDIALKARAVERARLVREGFLTEAEAARQASADRFEAEQAGLERELDLRTRRAEAARRQGDVELALLVVQARAQQAIREADLSAAIAIGRAETNAKVIELEAQLAARRAELVAEVQARAAAGLLSQEEADARAAQILAIERGTRAQITALVQGQIAKERALSQAAIASRTAAELALAAAIQGVQAEQARAGADAAADLTETQGRLAAAIAERREELRREGILTPAQIDQALRPAEALLSTAERKAKTAGREAADALAVVERALASVTAALTKAVEPFKDLVAALGSPERLSALIAQIQRLALPPAPGGPPAVAGAAAGAEAAPVLLFQVGGDLVARLEGDEAAIAAGVLGRLFGPEGGRQAEDFFKRVPGPRPRP